ncbi:FAD-dependent oxidoreductase [Nocardia sp. NPDC004068]|uniref:FAD-dependent oxidoreductase n=1 Tax=Nocardia sp. NPDC004068 TaxID=3364303 RepID=UPI003699B519
MGVLESDVLVVGGGPAGAWAALAAARSGARVILVDKGRCGASGPTAKSLVALANFPPGPAREEAVRLAFARGGRLGDPEWTHRVLAETHLRLDHLFRRGRVPHGDRSGGPTRIRLSGVRYLGLLRRSLLVAGVRILDHHPALRLLVDAEGVVAGASGLCSARGYEEWSVRAGAVVLATGGCAFLSGAAGADVATGDGLLMAAEVGGELSGMEFSSAYTLAPLAPLPPTPTLRFAAFHDESGAPLENPALGPHAAALEALANGRRVYATLAEAGGSEGAEPRVRPTLAEIDGSGGPEARVHPSFAEAGASGGAEARVGGRGVFATLEALAGLGSTGDGGGGLGVGGAEHVGAPRLSGAVQVRAVLAGTVRGTGGLRLTGFDCATTVPGLFAAGDVTSREAIAGAYGGVGGQRAAWAIASGMWAGTGAVRFARGRGRAVPARVGGGLRAVAGIDPRAVIGLVQEHTLPLRRSYWRSAGSLRDSIAELDALWPVTECDLGGTGAELLRAREAAALLAVARWTKHSALARTESRGIHRRTDHPGEVEDWRLRLHTGGVGTVWVAPPRDLTRAAAACEFPLTSG